MFSPLRRLRVILFCLPAFTSLVPISDAQNVTTWHNDNYRTGWQQNETILTQSNVNQSNFGLLWQWSVSGHVLAQPLAVANVPTTFSNCTPSCNLVFISTEMDMLYAFNAAPSAQSNPLVWSVNLASQVAATAVDCNNLNGVTFGACNAPSLSNGLIGVTGTPVIDTSANTLYVVGAVYFAGQSPTIAYYLFAVNIRSGAVLAKTPITATVPGQTLSNACSSANPLPGNTVSFTPSYHIQRSALLLLNGGVYVAFAPLPETYNGWLFGYQLSGGSLSQTAVFNSTPYGTGGGIWGSSAGPASDGSSIYLATGNGTFSYDTPGPPSAPVLNHGDSLLKLDPSTLTVSDYYTPSDVFTFPPIPPATQPGLCESDEDFASGGVLLIPDNFFNGQYLVVNADKESKLYVENRANLGQFNANGGNNIQTITTPSIPQNDPGQGYWASPAYWKYTTGSATTYMLYYSVTTQFSGATPKAINGYQLSTSGLPIPSPPTASTTTLFCPYSPTPSVSSNGTTVGTGIVWAIENPNTQNRGANPICTGTTYVPAVLHAFNATTLQQLYTSGAITTKIGFMKAFPTPTIFMGQVYMGTSTGPKNNLPGVDVFGMCSTVSTGCLQ